MKVAHTIKLQTYSCQLIFILTDQLKLESKKIYKKFKLVMEEDEGESEGIVLSPDIDKYFLINILLMLIIFNKTHIFNFNDHKKKLKENYEI